MIKNSGFFLYKNVMVLIFGGEKKIYIYKYIF